jgi:hypothetical protein
VNERSQLWVEVVGYQPGRLGTGLAIGRASAVSGPRRPEPGGCGVEHARIGLGAFSLDNVTASRVLRGAPGQSWSRPSVVLVSQARCSGWPEGARLLVRAAQTVHGTMGWS